MDLKRIDAYRFIANRALYDLRRISASYLHGLPRFAGFSRRHQRQIKFFANFAYAFHNLSLALEQSWMNEFDEDIFWNDFTVLQKEFSDLMIIDYRKLFDEYLVDEKSGASKSKCDEPQKVENTNEKTL